MPEIKFKDDTGYYFSENTYVKSYSPDKTQIIYKRIVPHKRQPVQIIIDLFGIAIFYYLDGGITKEQIKNFYDGKKYLMV